jgi:hypothetical protein
VIGQQLSGTANLTANSAAVGDKENPIRTRVLLRAVTGHLHGRSPPLENIPLSRRRQFKSGARTYTCCDREAKMEILVNAERS